MLSKVVFLLAILGFTAAQDNDRRPHPPNSCPRSCPDVTGADFTLNFDDIRCAGACPMPLTYAHFRFDGSAGWLVVNATSAASPHPGVATSGTIALESKSSGFVGFRPAPGEMKFTFDVRQFRFSIWSNSPGVTQGIFFMKGTTKSGETKLYNTTMDTGIYLAPNTLDLTPPYTSYLGFFDLVKIEFAAYTNYNAATKTGTPADITIDQFTYKRHADPCAT